jgi:methyl-accepting chemotaxis protein
LIELEELRTQLIENFIQTFSIVIVVIPVIIFVAYYFLKGTISFKLVVSFITLGVYINLLSNIINYTKLVEPDWYIQSFLAFLVVGVGLLTLIVYYLGNNFLKPLNQITVINEKLAEGIIEKKSIKHNENDEVGRLIVANKSLTDFLTGIVTSIINASNKLTTSSQELASSAEEMNASSEEISGITQVIAKSTVDQKNLVVESITESNSLKVTFIENMHNISTTIDTIGSLTGQVNILALNASIEAARAGEYGRGFAVVAANIQELAINTKAALDSIMDTSEGLQRTMYHAINGISEKIEKISRKAEETATNTEEASASAEEQTAGMEELTSASQELADLAENLRLTMGKFKIE